MSYEAGLYIFNEEERKAVAGYYLSAGLKFDADYVISDHVAATLFGYGCSVLSRDISSNRTRTCDIGDFGEVDIVPLDVLSQYATAYRAFVSTRGGKRMDACCALDVGYEIGNVTTAEDYSEGVVYVSPEDAVEAYRALGSTGHGDVLRELVDKGAINQLEDFSNVVDVLAQAGCSEVGWYGDD